MMDPTVHIAQIARLFVLVTLLVAAWGKSTNFRRFRDSLARSFPLPGNTTVLAALAVITAEWLIVGLIALGGAMSRVGLVAGFVVLSLFTVVIAGALARGQAIVCNCFGPSTQPISVHDLVRNALLLAACGFAFVTHPGDPGISRGSSIALIGVAVILFLITTSLRDIHVLLGLKPEDQAGWKAR